MQNLKAKYHSIETLGTLDGPGVRFVLFLQGCPLRCLYCHNPDTWNTSTGKEISIREVISLYEQKKDFYINGGITISGGEPMMQIEFLLELCKEMKQRNVHVCIDTSAIMYKNKYYKTKIEELINYVDLFLVDIKSMNWQKHIKLTGQSSEPVFDFITLLETKHKNMWIRHVVVPNLTTTHKDLEMLGEYLATLKRVSKLQLLPYHTMALFKYKELNLKYPLENVSDCDTSELSRAKQIVLASLKKKRTEILNYNRDNME